MTVALTLAAAGVDEDEVVADYARTEGLLPAERNRQIVEWLRTTHPDAVHLEDLATKSPAPVMQALLAAGARRARLAADYLRAHGLTRRRGRRSCAGSSSPTRLTSAVTKVRQPFVGVY